MTSCERVRAYTKLKQEAPHYIPEKDLEVLNKVRAEHNDENAKWPKHGKIECKNVFFSYRKGLDNTLKGISFTVEPGQKVACVGRTGAGKSSTIQAIYRMAELRGGQIFIDGTDVKELGLNFLRSNLSIIP